MAAKKDSFLDFVLDVLKPLGPIHTRSLFGGYGLYKKGIIFAILVDNTVYFKVDEQNRPYYEAKRSVPFSYKKGDKTITMSYWSLPLDVLEMPDELPQWVEAAYQAAYRAKMHQKK